MARVRAIAIGCLVVIAGCLSGGSPICPAIGPDGKQVDAPVCPNEQAGGLSLSVSQASGSVTITVESVAEETVLVNPDRWTVFRKADGQQQSIEETWRVAANAPAGTYNVTAIQLPPGESKSWQLQYRPNATNPENHRDSVLTQPGTYVFSLSVNNRTYVGSFRIGY